MPIKLDSEEEKRLANRIHTQNNRETWKKLGFRMTTTSVHDDDRALILAELEVRKFIRLAITAENDDTGTNTLRVIALRNVNKLPKKGEIDHVRTKAKNSTAQKDVELYIRQCF